MISAQTKIYLLCCKSNYCILNNDRYFEELTNEGEENSYEVIDKETDELYVKIWYKKHYNFIYTINDIVYMF